jgi:23S rRNA pseudouridine2605 synthase
MPAKKKTAPKKTAPQKTASKRTSKKKQLDGLEPALTQAKEEGAPELNSLQAIEDPIGDETDGEGATSMSEAEAEAAPALEAEREIEADADAAAGAELVAEQEQDGDADGDEGEETEAKPPVKLERLQKIMAQAGVASRRAAEKLIEEGRVQVNGKVVTELGTKADGGRDHIRVDGKLLHGAERLRYFVLNKPRGFVTTVKDPEGRPTVMQFFEKMRERLYPVGRLDYLSEGLLLVTNDGELANRLTKASLGVEKTYLVKVAGVPTEAELDRLRAGVAIDKGAPGEGRVRTSPARVRQVKHGDNPWYEVVLVEGRNRELRKMFEEIGHFVEKIRRVGYGPLVLDQEPGKLRELDEHELTLLRKAADGTLRTAKAKSLSKVKFEDSLPPEKPAFRGQAGKPRAWKKDGGKKSFGGAKPAFGRKTDRPDQSAGARPAWKRDDRAGQDSGGRPPQRYGAGAGATGRPTSAGPTDEGQRPSRTFADRRSGGRTFEKKPSFGRTFAGKPPAGRSFGEKPRAGGFGDKPRGGGFGDKPRGGGFGDKPRGGGFGDKPEGRSFRDKPAGEGAFGAKPAWKKPGDRPTGGFGRKVGGSDRPPFKRTFSPRPPTAREDVEPMNFEPRKPSRLRIEPIEGTDRGQERRPEGFRPQGARTRGSGPERGDRPREFKPRPFTPRTETGRGGGGHASGGGARTGRASFGRSNSGRDGGGRTDSPRPFRGEGGLARPFTTSSGKPRAGGPRPSSKPGKPTGAGWKPKPGGKPGFKSGPRPGGFKGKPGGKRRD